MLHTQMVTLYTVRYIEWGGIIVDGGHWGYVLIVSGAQDEIGNESPKRMEIASGLSFHILYQCRVRIKVFLLL